MTVLAALLWGLAVGLFTWAAWPRHQTAPRWPEAHEDPRLPRTLH